MTEPSCHRAHGEEPGSDLIAVPCLGSPVSQHGWPEPVTRDMLRRTATNPLYWRVFHEWCHQPCRARLPSSHTSRPRAAGPALLVDVVAAAGASRTVADRRPGSCSMRTGLFPVTEPTPYTVPPEAMLTLVIVLTGADKETVAHVVPDFSCKVPSPRPPPAAMSVPSAVSASAL